jgi:hypothetical protein
MHADLIFIRSGINHLETNGAKTVNCQMYGLTSIEPVNKVRQLADEWKQPFQKEYNERSVNQAFEKLLALRSDVENTIEKVLGKPMGSSLTVNALESTSSADASHSAVSASKNEKSPASGAGKAANGDPTLDFESCLEKVWEQLISAPPSRGRSMTTVRIGAARLLMSSWEVTAFVSEDSPAAEDLRRAVVARALVTSAIEQAKEAGNTSSLDHVLPIARVEVSRLQERVEVAKQAKDTEAAVNLGISTKRLLSALDEAEKL